MAKSASPAPAHANASDELVCAVDRLTGELALLRQVMDEIREEFSWLTRNGLSVQPIEHVHVKRMALDPCADDWGKRLEIERSTYHPRGAVSPLDSEALDHIAEDLKTTMQAVAQEQLEVVLTALDGVRAEILSTLKRRRGEPAGESSSEAPRTRAPEPAIPSGPKPPLGQLF